MINEVALILLVGLVGWKIAIKYVLTGLTIAIISGFVIEKLKLQKYVADWVFQVKSNQQNSSEENQRWSDRIQFGLSTTREIAGKIWLYVLIGIAIGDGAHGCIPDNYLANVLGNQHCSLFHLPLW